MISEQQQELAGLYALGALPDNERLAFEETLRAQPDVRELVHELQRVLGLVARAVPPVAPPQGLRQRILDRIGPAAPDLDPNRPASAPPAPALPPVLPPGFLFVAAQDPTGWKHLPTPGASIKLLRADLEQGYAVLLGRLSPGARYPAHTHEGAEDLFLVSGDLHVGSRQLGPGDFHHSDPGTSHPDNHSVEGCTLLAVLSIHHALAKFAMAEMG